jgi:NAD(P) transhydrogenase subunit beta
VDPRTLFTELSYIVASILFILGLRGLSHPDTARRGMHLAEIGMLLAIIGTLVNREIISYEWILAGLLIGSAIGVPMGLMVPMTAMPQRTALSHAFGALAASLVGISEYYLHGVLPGAPLTYKGQNICNLILLGITVLCFILLLVFPGHAELFYLMLLLSFVFGVLLVLPIGAADMPVVIALLNAYAGLASAATGLVIGNNVLIIAGMLDGGAGFILSIVMCKAMNRSITNVLFGAFGSVSETVAASDGEMRATNIEDVAILLAYARQAVFVPGYGMATAQAQHVLRQLADALEKRGVTVKYAIHPVAGRMPGHMNVLLAEANVPYSQLQELEVINPEFPSTDVAVVIGANDVVNPDARDNPKSIIAGMPILEVDRAKTVVVLKRGQGKGFSGLVNPLFFKPNCEMLYGDAKESLTNLVQAVHAA